MGLFDFILDPLFGDDNDPYKAQVREVDAEAFRDPNAPDRRVNLQAYDNQVQGRGDVAGLGGVGAQADQLAALGRGEGTTTAEKVLKGAQETNVANQLGAANAGPQGGAGGLRALASGIGQGNRQTGIDAATAAGQERLSATQAAGSLYGSQGQLGLSQRQIQDQARQFGFQQIAGEDQQQIQNSIDLEQMRQNRDLGVGQIESGSFDASQDAKRKQTSGILDFLSDATAKTDVVGQGPFSDANAKMNITSDANAKTNIMSDIGTKTNLGPTAFGGVEMAQAMSGNPFQTAPAQTVPTFQGKSREELVASGMSEEEVNKALMGQAGDRAQFDQASRESLNVPSSEQDAIDEMRYAQDQKMISEEAFRPEDSIMLDDDSTTEQYYDRGRQLSMGNDEKMYEGDVTGYGGGMSKDDVAREMERQRVTPKVELQEFETGRTKPLMDNMFFKALGPFGEGDSSRQQWSGGKQITDKHGRTEKEADQGFWDRMWDTGKEKGKEEAEKQGSNILPKVMRFASNLFSDIDTKSNVEASPIGGGGDGEKKDYGANPIPNPMDKITEMAGPIAAVASMFSDHRGKENVGNPEVGQFLDALTPYSYDYKDKSMGEGRHLGVMAQDVEKGGPIGESMVIETPRGKALDSKKMMSAEMAALADLNKRLDALEGTAKPKRKR